MRDDESRTVNCRQRTGGAHRSKYDVNFLREKHVDGSKRAVLGFAIATHLHVDDA